MACFITPLIIDEWKDGWNSFLLESTSQSNPHIGVDNDKEMEKGCGDDDYDDDELVSGSSSRLYYLQLYMWTTLISLLLLLIYASA